MQVENMLYLCKTFIDATVRASTTSPSFSSSSSRTRLRVVEFCCGTGFLGIPLAALYPGIDIILIDQKVNKLTALASHSPSSS